MSAGTVWAVVDDLDVILAVFPDDRGAGTYLTRYGDDDDGAPCLWIVTMTRDEMRDALGEVPTLPHYL